MASAALSSTTDGVDCIGYFTLRRIDMAYARNLIGVVKELMVASLGLEVMTDHIAKHGTKFMTKPEEDSLSGLESSSPGDKPPSSKSAAQSSSSSSSSSLTSSLSQKSTSAQKNPEQTVGIEVLNEKAKNATDAHWKEASRKIVRNAILVGFSAVVRKYTPEGHPYPHVLDHSMFDVLQIVDTLRFDKYYLAVRTVEFTQRHKLTAKYVVIPNSHVVMVTQPDEVNGRADSPVSSAYHEITRARTCDDALSQSLFQSMSPVVTIENTGVNPNSTLYGSKNTAIGEIDLHDMIDFERKEARADRTKQLQENKREAYATVAKAAAASYLRASSVLEQARFYHESEQLRLATLYKLNSPVLSAIEMPVGEQFKQLEVRPPAPVALEYCSELERKILVRIGLSPQLVGLVRANYAANTDLAFGWFNSQSERYQRQIQPALAKLFEFVYGINEDDDLIINPDGSLTVLANDGDDNDYASDEDIYDDQAQLRRGLVQFSDSEEDDNSSSSDDYGHKHRSRAHRSKRRKHTHKQLPAYQGLITEHSEKRPPKKTSSSHRPLGGLRGKITVDLGCTPLFNIEELRSAFEWRVIAHRQFKEKTAAQLNIPKHEIFEDDYTYEELMQLNSMRPDDEDGDGGSKAKTPKKKTSGTNQSVSNGTGRKTTDSARTTSTSH